MRLFSILMVLGMIAPQSMARDKVCAAGEFGQFDFWIGEWEVSEKGEIVGHNSISPIMDGCVLQEHWRGVRGSEGVSLNFYNPDSGKWRQYWVWKNGGTLPILTGNYTDGKMVLQGSSKTEEGKTSIDRITWFNNQDGTVRQLWENSTDEGATWKILFDGLYTRKK